MGQFAIGLHTCDQRAPGLAHGGLAGRTVQQALVHAPGKGIGVKTRAAGFLERIARRIQQAGAPQAVGLLAGEDFGGHFLELLFEAGRAGWLDGRYCEHADQAAHHPAVAAAPEDFFAVGLAFVEVGAVAVIEMLVFVVEVIRGAPPMVDGEIQIARIAGGDIQAEPAGGAMNSASHHDQRSWLPGVRNSSVPSRGLARMSSKRAFRGASIFGSRNWK